MKAVRYHEYGDPSVLKLEEVPSPTPGAGEVLVRIRAVGVHPMDWKTRAGYLKDFMPVEFPHVPGYEFAGTVESAGEDVTGFGPGDDVFGSGSRTYAELAVVPVSTLARMPASLTFPEAATLGVSGVTALRLVDTAELAAGQRVLIHGGAGGVGALCVQLAHHRRAHVIATTSAANIEHVRALGADEVLDYDATPFETAVSGVDVVLDTVGGDVTERSWGVLKPGGLLINIAGRPDLDSAKAHGVRTTGLGQVTETAPFLERLAELVEAGVVRPQVAATFPIEAVAQAHGESQTGHGRGRRVVTIA